MLLAVMARDWATPFRSRKQHLNTLDRTCHQQFNVSWKSTILPQAWLSGCATYIYALSVWGYNGSISAPHRATLKAEAHALQWTAAGPYNAIHTSLLGACMHRRGPLSNCRVFEHAQPWIWEDPGSSSVWFCSSTLVVSRKLFILVKLEGKIAWTKKIRRLLAMES